MPAHIALLVLFAALLHATWNTIVKGGENKLYESALNALGGGLGALCLVPFLSFPASAAWPFLGLSCCCHLAYYVSIAEVYKVVDLSVGYTIMRGSAPLFTAVAMVSLGTSLSPAGWGGLLAICSGIACLALQGGPSRLGRHGLWLVLRTAFIIMGYTLSDGFGGQRSGDSVGYACWIFVLNIFPLHAVVLARSGRWSSACCWPFCSWGNVFRVCARRPWPWWRRAPCCSRRGSLQAVGQSPGRRPEMRPPRVKAESGLTYQVIRIY